MIAAGFFAARTHGIDIWTLIGVGIVAAIVGEIVGFWIGRRYGHQLLARHGSRVGLTPGRIRIGQWLFARYGGRFVFIARFLPILRNMAAVLAGTNAMAQPNFYFASATAASAWIMCYGLAAYSFGEAFGNMASPAAAILGLAAAATVLTVPLFIVRYEKRLQAKADEAHSDSEPRASQPRSCRPGAAVRQPSQQPPMCAASSLDLSINSTLSGRNDLDAVAHAIATCRIACRRTRVAPGRAPPSPS